MAHIEILKTNEKDLEFMDKIAKIVEAVLFSRTNLYHIVKGDTEVRMDMVQAEKDQREIIGVIVANEVFKALYPKKLLHEYER